jgi:alpha-D-xyloside xylohydrolase
MRGTLLGLLAATALAACDDDGGATPDRDAAPPPADAAPDATAADAAPDAVAPDAAAADAAPDAARPPTGPEVVSGSLRAVLDGDTLHVLRGDVPLLRFPADALQLGLVRALEERFYYDPYPVLAKLRVGIPPGLRWVSPSSVTLAQGEAFTLALDYGDDGRATLQLVPEGDGRLRATLHPDAGHPIAFFRLRPRAGAEEAFYGLGEYLDDVNHRGRVRAMQFEADLGTESGYNEAHVPIPFLIGTRGWGLFVESDRVGAFAPGVEAPDVVDVAFAAGPRPQEGLRFHLFAADHPLDVTRHYYEVTGYPGRIARWALGPLVWRDENRDQAQVEADALAMRELDLAASAMWIDRPYASGVNSFDFEPARFPDPPAMVARLHALGYRLALWHTPYVGEEQAATAALHAEAEANGYYPPRVGVIANDWGRPVDFLNPAAFAWWQGLVRGYTDLGVEGFKLDYAEDVVPGLFGLRNVWEFADGSDERTAHREYFRQYHRAYAETLPAEGGFLLVRSGSWGGQVLGPIVWPGDLDASFAKHRERVDERGDRYTAVGGLPASVVAGLTLGPSGFPFYGADTGGYRHSPTEKELFIRWFQQTALSSVMQIGTSANDVAWEFRPENGFDQESLDLYRTYTRLHLRLWPYLWTYAERVRIDGRPIQRPYGLMWPETGRHPSDTYAVGDHLLVAPVLERGQRERAVAFPPGRWADWWTGEVLEAGERTVPAPLDKLPLYLAEGGIVPLLRPTIDTLSPTSAPDLVDSYATTPGVLYARVFPGESRSEFTLFDGARLAAAGDVVETADGAEFTAGFVLEVHGPEPAAVTIDDAPAGFTWDAARRLAVVEVPAGTHRVRFAR